MRFIKKFFKLDEKKTSIKVELLAGITTFLAMLYILPTNAGMLSSNNTGMPYGGVFLATALAAIIATLIMGLVANYPIGLAPGMGINAFFVFNVALIHGFKFALSASLIAGVIFLIVSVSGLRKFIINAIPMGLKYAIGGGIGFFITFIGLQNSGLIVQDPATFVTLGEFYNPGTMITIFGLIIGLILYIKGNKFSIIIALVSTVIVGTIFGLIYEGQGLPEFNNDVFETFKNLGSIKDIFGQAFTAIPDVLKIKEGYFIIFTFLFVDFFDTAGTLSAVGVSANLIDEETGELENGDKALLADAIGTVAGATLGTSTTTSFIESQTGVEQGGRTGLTAVVVAIMFGIAIFLYPLFELFTGHVTSIALIMVGALMMRQLGKIDWENKELVIASFFTIIFMILTYSIADGIAIGFIMYVILMVSTQKRKEVHPVMYGLALFFVIYYLTNTLNDWYTKYYI